MRVKLWKRIACAACLTVVTAGAYGAAAAGLPSNAQRCSGREAPAAEPLVRGERLLRFCGYELNVAFTPGGRLVGFDITSAPRA
ncbi:MAG TPA: hypothetical protein VN228_15750 [Pyrinomonadaceae bacterium]|nr:hypothetical protein [Pyrinomonadaceae bacterium]